jgi:hypothetical protein
MDEKRKFPFLEIIFLVILIIGAMFLMGIPLIFAKRTEKQPEIEPTDAGTENDGKPMVDPVVSEPISAPPEPEIHFPAILTETIPPRPKRKRITRKNLATIFRHGSRKLNLTTAVAELKGLGFGHSSAYQALKPEGQFSVWLRFAPDGMISWTDGYGT